MRNRRILATVFATALLSSSLSAVNAQEFLQSSSGVIASRIDDDFEGWDGDTIFILENGQIWQQDGYAYTYHYSYRPRVIIFPSDSRWKLKVDGLTSTIYVKRLK